MPGCSAPPPPIPAGPTSIDLEPVPGPRRHRSRTPGSSSPPVRPEHVASWRDRLAADGQTNSTHPPQADRPAVAVLLPPNLRLQRGQPGPRQVRQAAPPCPATARPSACRRTIAAACSTPPQVADRSGQAHPGRASATGPCSPCWPIPVAASASWCGSASAITRPAASTAS